MVRVQAKNYRRGQMLSERERLPQFIRNNSVSQCSVNLSTGSVGREHEHFGNLVVQALTLLCDSWKLNNCVLDRLS